MISSPYNIGSRIAADKIQVKAMIIWQVFFVMKVLSGKTTAKNRSQLIAITVNIETAIADWCMNTENLQNISPNIPPTSQRYPVQETDIERGMYSVIRRSAIHMFTMKKLIVFLIRRTFQTTAIMAEFPHKDTITRIQYVMTWTNLTAVESLTKHSSTAPFLCSGRAVVFKLSFVDMTSMRRV